MVHAQLPLPLQITQALSGIIGKQATAKPTPAPAVIALNKAFVGHYDDGLGATEGAWVSDLPLSASLGAALALIPVGVVDEAISAGKVAPELAENLREVINIIANSFLHKRVRLVGLTGPGQAHAPEAIALIQARKQLLHVEVTVAGYRAGTLSLVGA